MKIVKNFIFLGSKVTSHDDCHHEIKSHLPLGRKAMTKLDRVLKTRDITFPTNAHLAKVLAFPVVMYGCESWTIKKAEYQRIDAFELWCWRRPLRVPWTANRSNQAILKEMSPEYSLEGLMLKLKLQYFGHLMQRADSLERTLMLGNIEGRKRSRWQRWHHRLNGHEFQQAPEMLEDKETWHSAVHGVTCVCPSQTQLNDWTTTNSN